MPILVDLGPYLADESVPISYTRREEGVYDAGGRWIAGAPVTTDTIAVVQPVVGIGGKTHLQDLPEGIRHEIRLITWTEVRLRLEDIVHWQDNDYRVIWLWDREHDGGYTRAGLGLLHPDTSVEPPYHDMRPLT